MKIFLFIIAIGIVITGTILVATHRYPVAIVNMSWITARDFNAVHAASYRFYMRALETYGKEQPGAAEQATLDAEIRRASLDRLIEKELIWAEAKTEIPELAQKIEEKIKNVDSQKLQNPVREMYGLSVEEFRHQVLAPQAVQELLAAALAARGESLMAHLITSRKNARVILLLSGFAWIEKGVELKK